MHRSKERCQQSTDTAKKHGIELLLTSLYLFHIKKNLFIIFLSVIKNK